MHRAVISMTSPPDGRLSPVALPRAAAVLLTAVLAAALPACGDGEADACQGGSGTVCTWAGTGQRAFNGDGNPRQETAFYWPLDLEFAPDGRAYLLDWNNHRVRRVNADGRLETVVGTDFVGDGPPDQSDLKIEGAPGTSVELNHPTDLEFLPGGELLVAAWHNHKIRRYDPSTGRVRVICGSTPGDQGDGRPAARALLNQPKSIALDASGNLFIADSRNQRIRRVDAATEVIETVAGTGKIGSTGDGLGPLGATFHMQESNENPEPGGNIALDGEGRIYVADTFNNRVRVIDLRQNVVRTVAGTGDPGMGGDGGPATEAKLMRPRDVEIGPDGRLYIADTDNHRIRAVDLATGVITTVAGRGTPGFSGDGGPAGAAMFNRPFGVAFDRDGNLFVTDTFNNRIRKVLR